MLINGMCNEEGRRLGGERSAAEYPRYQTEEQLFELMTTGNDYDINDDRSLNTRDLIFLYKNIDVDTKITANVNGEQRRPPNQLVETIVYNDDKDSEVSDDSEIYSNEDVQDIFLINNERIDLINTMPSIPHCLCHKCGDLKFQWSNLTSDYDRQFLFKDPYIKQQLKNINLTPEMNGFNSMLPASLLDYICCRRLDDNYNFYMENIIIYVKHTIEQLRRISNGDFLTEEAREKWREVEKDFKIPRSDDTKALATSVSIPLHVESKVNGHRSTWDDIVHSEVDVRSLSKILEKKIIIEIPKVICGSYKLFSRQRNDNLIITCQKDSISKTSIVQDREESRVDVVFQLKRSGSGHVISNINSIMILHKMPSITSTESNIVQCQQLELENNVDAPEKRVTIVEIVDEDKNEDEQSGEHRPDIEKTSAVSDCINENTATTVSSSEKHDEALSNQYYFCSSESSIVDKGVFTRKLSPKITKTESDLTIISPDELRCTIQRLNMQAPLLEEPESVNKKKSPTRVRIKSPYENKSFHLEEKKRKRLLEIREKREKKKIALSENCKVKKHKSGKGAIMAQPSSSVTKLSITNKSFYNSIYGESLHHESAITKKACKWQKKDLGLRKDEFGDDFLKSSLTTFGHNSFDDGCTETVMQMQQNLNAEKCFSPHSAGSCYDKNINLLTNLVTASGTDGDSISEEDSSPLQKTERDEPTSSQNEGDDLDLNEQENSGRSFNLVPMNTPKHILSQKCEDERKKTLSPIECRKSIDKIYDLMKKLEKIDESEVSQSSKHNSDQVQGRRSSTIQMSDSGTSIKHHDTSSNPSSFSFGKVIKANKCSYTETDKKEVTATVVPKVIISTKLQTSKGNIDRSKSDRKRNITSPPTKVPDNPLKAISQLLHEFDNVQKNRCRAHKKSDHDDIKTSSRQGSSKKPRQEQPQKEAGVAPARTQQCRERRSRSGRLIDTQPLTHQATYVDDKGMNRGRSARRNISDIIDEAKEARGEAVRGPPRPYSRLNTLAQPKKLYIQAQNEEYQNRYGKNNMVPRIQRTTISAPVVDKNIPTTYLRNRRRGLETAPVPSIKSTFPTVSPIERVMRPRRSASNSPARKNVSPIDSSFQTVPYTMPVTPEKLIKKMVAVESYVKTHYGPIDTNQAMGREVHKSRVPLIPNDIELESMTSSPTAEESTELGNKLHYMINTMINNAPCLSVLAETKESTTKLSLEKLTSDSLLKIAEHKSESDYIVDIFEDKNIVTAVASLPRDKTSEDSAVDENSGDVENTQYDVQKFSSATELRKLENALYQKMSVGTLPKRLRIKNLTLTPKQSLQQIIVVQSGDAGSLLIKSSLSQSFRTSESKTDSLTALKPFTAISSTHIKWGPTDIPLQVATIGYAFPTYQSVQSRSISPRLNTLHERKVGPKPTKKEITQGACKSNKTSQCFKGVHAEASTEQSTQANIPISIPSSRNLNLNTTEKEQEIIIESDHTSKEKCNKAEDIVTSKLPEPITDATQTSQITVTSKIDKDVLKEDTPLSQSQSNIDHSTSLDILMGLLNEIRKVTGGTGTKNVDKVDKYNTECKDLEVILKATNQDSLIDKKCRDIVSNTSLDKLEQLHSNPSIYFYNSLKNEQEHKEPNYVTKNVEKKLSICDQLNVDKGINVDLEKQYVNRFTDAPSCFLSVTINRSSSVTDTIFGVMSEPSTQSVYSIAEYDTLYCSSAYSKIMDIPKIETIEVLENYDSHNDPDTLQLKLAKTNELSTVAISNTSEYAGDKIGDTYTNKNSNAIIEVYREFSRKLTRNLLTNETVDTDFDPLIKMKRDILVTVYSFLVFTVFAALSFPKLFYYHLDM